MDINSPGSLPIPTGNFEVRTAFAAAPHQSTVCAGACCAPPMFGSFELQFNAAQNPNFACCAGNAWAQPAPQFQTLTGNWPPPRLSDEDVERIARRVAKLLKEQKP